MESIREWLFCVVTASVLSAAAQTLVPEGTFRRMIAFIGGLILMLVILRPLTDIDPKGVELHLDRYRREIASRQAELQQAGEKGLAELIAERTGAYIVEKGDALGVQVQVRVLTETGTDGIPVPVAAELTGGYSEALSAYMEQELGIPAERQVWHEN